MPDGCALPLRVFTPLDIDFSLAEGFKVTEDFRGTVLFFHGGGWVNGDVDFYTDACSAMALRLERRVVSVDYRLAPEHPYPAAVEDAMRAWDYLMYQGYGARDVVVAGDSAGGNLALVLTHLLKEAGRRLHRALILFSPRKDMTASGKTYQERESIDPVLPTLIQAGTNEILLSDSIRLRDRLIQAAVPCRLEVWTDLWHVFQMFPMKKAGEAMESVGRFLLETL